ncbi:hypothetical protein NP493_194g02002 [Ridgeia piscesae]|uniref:EGF-like domain-containing protein n=1 Tax=Ridgeia piscesae TaxID=27915 RepID=A0AAD9P225_RIDPI|nr:hypothetical protein NP493_194g02002 [Ridgeia piscesae]
MTRAVPSYMPNYQMPTVGPARPSPTPNLPVKRRRVKRHSKPFLHGHRGVALLVLAMIAIMIGVIVGIIVLAGQKPPEPPEKQEVQGKVKLDGKEYVNAYGDKNSPEYKQLAHQFCGKMMTTLTEGDLGDDAQQCRVDSFKKGSIDVLFTIIVQQFSARGSDKKLIKPDALAEVIKKDIVKERTYKYCGSNGNNSATRRVYQYCGSNGNNSATRRVYRYCGSNGNNSATRRVYRYCSSNGNNSATRRVYRYCGSNGNNSATRRTYSYSGSRQTYLIKSVTGICTNTTCENDGICNDTNGAVVCSCADGYSGARCGHELTFCELQNPCQNGGTCIDRGEDNYLCVCPKCNCSDAEPFDNCTIGKCVRLLFGK